MVPAPAFLGCRNLVRAYVKPRFSQPFGEALVVIKGPDTEYSSRTQCPIRPFNPTLAVQIVIRCMSQGVGPIVHI